MNARAVCPQLASASESETRNALLGAFRRPPGTSVGTRPQLLTWRQLVNFTLLELPDSPPMEVVNRFLARFERIGQNEFGGSDSDADDIRRLMASVWRLVSEGVFYLRFFTDLRTGQTFIDAVGLTDRGLRLTRNPSEHPLAANLANRLRERCVGLPDDVIARFEDAQVCLGAHLYRAAVVMVGLAFEETVDRLVDHLVASGHAKAKPKSWKLGDRTEWLRRRVEQLPKSEARRRALNTVPVLEMVRQWRNEAAHPGPQFEDRAAEVEHVAAVALGALPSLWAITGV